MGNDDMAVVDQDLRVHGLPGLRVIDASIMPTLISGNTQATSIMIGEKGAHHILDPAAAPTSVGEQPSTAARSGRDAHSEGVPS